jgi:multidrug transporter EmrE-like cation transporter
MAWFLLSIAIVAEIAGTLFLKASDGLSKLWLCSRLLAHGNLT